MCCQPLRNHQHKNRYQRLKWREYLGVNTLWGMLTDKNNPMLERNASDGRLFFFPGSFVDGTYEYASRVISPRKPYVEVVVGIHNIFKVLHVEYVQRLNYICPIHIGGAYAGCSVLPSESERWIIILSP